jgi:hypothetical protein
MKASRAILKNISYIMLAFSVSMALFSVYLESQHFFQDSILLQRLFIGIFGGGEIALIFLFAYIGRVSHLLLNVRHMSNIISKMRILGYARTAYPTDYGSDRQYSFAR